MLSDKVKVIANAFIMGMRKNNIAKPFKERLFMDSKRLQHLLYLFQIEYMKAYEGKPAFDEDFYAWPSGPLIPDLDAVYLLNSKADGTIPCKGTINLKEKRIIENILDATCNIDTKRLIRASMSLGSPWIHAYNVDDEAHKQVITKGEIYRFYFDRDLREDILK